MALSVKNIKPNLKAIKDTVVARFQTKKNIKGIGMSAYKEHWNEVAKMPGDQRGYNKNHNIGAMKYKEAVKDIKKQIPSKYLFRLQVFVSDL